MGLARCQRWFLCKDFRLQKFCDNVIRSISLGYGHLNLHYTVENLLLFVCTAERSPEDVVHILLG